MAPPDPKRGSSTSARHERPRGGSPDPPPQPTPGGGETCRKLGLPRADLEVSQSVLGSFRMIMTAAIVFSTAFGALV